MKKKYIKPLAHQTTLMARTHILNSSSRTFTLTGNRNDTYEVNEDEWEE